CRARCSRRRRSSRSAGSRTDRRPARDSPSTRTAPRRETPRTAPGRRSPCSRARRRLARCAHQRSQRPRAREQPWTSRGYGTIQRMLPARSTRLAIVIGTAVVALATLLFARGHWNTLYDDALIYARYVKNLHAGCGPTFSCGEPPVEGFTSPLYLVVL